jgi:colicin import membrane protein
MSRLIWYSTQLLFAIILILSVDQVRSAPLVLNSKNELETERKALDANLAAQLRACASNFAVSDCENAAKREHQQRSRALQARQHAASKAERQQRAQEQRADIASRVAERAGEQNKRTSLTTETSAPQADSRGATAAVGAASIKARERNASALKARAPKAVKPRKPKVQAAEKQSARVKKTRSPAERERKQAAIAKRQAAIEKKTAPNSGKPKAKPLPEPKPN